jgi:archaellum component FlaG (FlaF/FlaG flagellin family)
MWEYNQNRNIQSDVKGVGSSTEIVDKGRLYLFIDGSYRSWSGVEFAQYKQKVFLEQPSATLTNFEVDQTGSAFSYTITTSNYKECQTLQAIQIFF